MGIAQNFEVIYEEIKKAEYANKTNQEIADALNKKITKTKAVPIADFYAWVIDTRLFKALYTGTVKDSLLKEVDFLINAQLTEISVLSDSFQALLTDLVSAGVITSTQKTTLTSKAYYTESRAEELGISVKILPQHIQTCKTEATG